MDPADDDQALDEEQAFDSAETDSADPGKASASASTSASASDADAGTDSADSPVLATDAAAAARPLNDTFYIKSDIVPPMCLTEPVILGIDEAVS